MRKKSLLVGTEITYHTLSWALWTIGIATAIYMAAILLIPNGPTPSQEAWVMVHQVYSVFSFIVGIIIGVYMITYYVKHGVTRKTFIQGLILHAIIFVLSMLVIAFILQGLSYLLFGFRDTFIGDGLISYVAQGYTGLTGMLIFILSLLTHYGFGLLIGFGFYKSGSFGAMMIVVTVVLYSVLAVITSDSTSLHFLFFEWQVPPIQSLYLAMGLHTLIMVGVYGMLYQLIKDIPIKMS